MMIEQYSEEERNEIVAYGIERGKIIFISVIITLIAGALFGILAQSIIFLLTFCLLRRYAGGYHADSQERCYVISFTVIVVTFWIMRKLQYNMIADVLINALCLMFILILAPVENHNRQLEEYERIKYGKKTKIIAIIISFLNVFLRWKGYYNIIIPILTAYSIVSISLVLGYIKKAKEDKVLLNSRRGK